MWMLAAPDGIPTCQDGDGAPVRMAQLEPEPEPERKSHYCSSYYIQLDVYRHAYMVSCVRLAVLRSKRAFVSTSE